MPLAQTVEKPHGRIETRQLWCIETTPEEIGFFGARQLIRLRRRRQTPDKDSLEEVLVVTSADPLPDPIANAAHLLRACRAHWTIENGLHHTRDRSYDEDRCQVRDPNAAQLLASMRSLAGFLAFNRAHHPKSDRGRNVPSFNRFCADHKFSAIRWLFDPKGPALQ